MIQTLNEELEQRVVDRTRELSALYDVSVAASEALNLNTMLQQSLERTLAAMNSNAGAIHLLDEGNDIVTEKELHLAVAQDIQDIMMQLESAPVESNPGYWIIKHNEPLVGSNIVNDPRIPPTIYDCGFSV